MRVSKYIRYIKMNVHRRRRTLVYGGLAIIMAFILVLKCKNNVRFISSNMDAKSHDVWEYVSDFSNMMKLNPTITKFIITQESSNHRQWNYTVEYEEHLSQLPFITNKIVGNFVVDKTQSEHAIKSIHRTCFAKIYCLDTTSKMSFEESSNGSRIVEIIAYECPLILTRFCMNEVMYQRKEIFGQLQIIFRPHSNHYSRQ